MDDTIFDSQNAAYAQAMFEQYARNPDSVPPEWRALFEDGADLAVAEGLFVPDQLNGLRAPTPGAPMEPITTPDGTVVTDAEEAAQVVAEASAAADHLRRVLPMVSRATALVQARQVA